MTANDVPKGTKKNIAVPPSTVVVGLDMSMTSTGICIKRGDTIELVSIKTVPKKFPIEFDRYNYIVNTVWELIPEDVALVAIEDFFTPQSRNQMGAAIMLVRLGHQIRMRMYENGVPFIIPAAAQLKKFVSGKGSIPKDQVCKEVFKRWQHDPTNQDEGDACVAAYLADAIARHKRGEDISTLPKFQIEVAKKVLKERPFFNVECFV